MIANPPNLIAKRLGCNGVIVLLPFFPSLPEIATAPAGDDHDAFAIAQLQKPSALGLAFKADGVEIHVFDVAEFLDFAFGRRPQKHIGRPSAAPNEDWLAVDFEDAIALVVEFGRGLANAEAD